MTGFPLLAGAPSTSLALETPTFEGYLRRMSSSKRMPLGSKRLHPGPQVPSIVATKDASLQAF
jgi:hypothetical protein